MTNMAYNFRPSRDLFESIGKATRRWLEGWFYRLYVDGYIEVPEQAAAPSAPDANHLRIYSKDVGAASHLFHRSSDGTETDLSLAATPQATALDDVADPDADSTIDLTDYNLTLDSGRTDADMFNFQATGAFGDVSVVVIEQKTGNPTDGTLLELKLAAGETNPDFISFKAGATEILNLSAAGILTLPDVTIDADGLITTTPDGGGTGFTITPSAALATGIDVSAADIVDAINIGANVIKGTTGSIDFTNFDVSAAGAVTCVSLTAGSILQDAITAATAGATITMDGLGAGGVTIGATSTGTITLGGGATLVNLPANVDLVLAGGDLTATDTANADMVTFTNNTMTTADLLTLSASGTRTSNNVIAIADGATTATTIGIVANAQTSGNGILYGNTGAALTGAAIRLNVTDGAGFTGYYLQCYDGAADDFSVKRYGAVVIGGLASTDMLTITAGDLQLTAGDIDVDLGIITVDNTADEGNRIARNNAVGTAAVLEIENTHATGGIALLIDQKSTTAAHYGIDFTSAGGTHAHFTANGAAGDGVLFDVTNAHTGQLVKMDMGPWVGTLGEGAGLDFRSDSAGTSEAGHAIYIKMQGTGVDAAAIDGKGLYIEDEAAATAGSYLVKLDTLANTALHISNAGAAADGIKFDVANSYTGQGIVADLGPWLGTTNEGFIQLTSDNAATVPAGQFIRMRQLGTGQHAAAIGGTLLYMEDDAAAPAAGTSYAMLIDATNIEAIHVDTGKVLVDETVTATGGLSSGTAADSFIFTDTVELSNDDIKNLRASPKQLVAAPGANKFIEFISAVLILDYGSEVLTEADDDLVIQYNTSGVDASATIQTTGFIDQAANQMAFIPAATIATVPAANVVNKALELFNSGGDEYAGNASNDTTMTVKVSYRIHADGL